MDASYLIASKVFEMSTFISSTFKNTWKIENSILDIVPLRLFLFCEKRPSVISSMQPFKLEQFVSLLNRLFLARTWRLFFTVFSSALFWCQECIGCTCMCVTLNQMLLYRQAVRRTRIRVIVLLGPICTQLHQVWAFANRKLNKPSKSDSPRNKRERGGGTLWMNGACVLICGEG